MSKPRKLPRPGLLRWEIGAALTVKLILLMGLWWLLFRWQSPPDNPPDIASRLALPADPLVFPQIKP